MCVLSLTPAQNGVFVVRSFLFLHVLAGARSRCAAVAQTYFFFFLYI